MPASDIAAIAVRQPRANALQLRPAPCVMRVYVDMALGRSEAEVEAQRPRAIRWLREEVGGDEAVPRGVRVDALERVDLRIEALVVGPRLQVVPRERDAERAGTDAPR